MKIRRYLGNNAQEAMLKVKMDLGSEAIILNTRKVRKKGLLKLFSKPMVEVLAAMDENNGRHDRVNSDVVKRNPQPDTVKIGEDEKRIQNHDIKNEIEKYFDKKEEKIANLENKVNSIEGMLQKIYKQIQPSVQYVKTEEKAEDSDRCADMLQLFYKNLVKNEVDEINAKKIIDAAKEKLGSNTDLNGMASVMTNMIMGMLGKPEIINLRDDGKPTVIIFVGPTGVGKTTTLAKIAANFSLNMRKKVGLITADTYRIAAVEQLKTYAEILGIPAAVAYSEKEVKDAINMYSDKDVVLIDTAGRSHRNKEQFEELKGLITAIKADEVYLVMSTAISNNSCRELLENYSFLKDYKLIFTKLDEASATGIILNTRFWTGKNLSYITTGQSVPDDIEIANIEKITKNLLGSMA